MAIIGVGGLGCTVAKCLAGAGIGRLELIDDGIIELSNLNRQFLYRFNDVGFPKAEIAAKRLSEQNPFAEIAFSRTRITEENVIETFAKSSLVIDCLDNFESRYIVNLAAVAIGNPFIHGACRGFEGRAMTIVPNKTACLKCAIPYASMESNTPIIGSTAVFVASIQASEAVRTLVGLVPALEGKMLFADLSMMRFETVSIPRDSECRICGRT